MDEGPCIAVEVDRLIGVEEHVLARIYLQNEVFQRTHTHLAGYLVGLSLGDIGQGVDFIAGYLLGFAHHGIHQVIGIDHRALATLHLAVGQFDHAVREVDQLLAKGEA